MEQFEVTGSSGWSLLISGPEEEQRFAGPCFTVDVYDSCGGAATIGLSIEQAHALKYYLIEQLGQ